MTVYLSKPGGRVVLQARAEGNGAIGDLTIELEPGESAFGRHWDEWDRLPEGAYEVN